VAGTYIGGPDNALLEAVVAMAQRLGLDVIQEGIEKIDQLSRLRAMGCRLGQGHLLSVAVSAEAVEPLLAVSTPFPHIGLYPPDSPARLAWADGAIRPRAST
jgi:hypothetical protein